MISVSNQYEDDFRQVFEKERDIDALVDELRNYGFIVTDDLPREEERAEEAYKKLCLEKSRQIHTDGAALCRVCLLRHGGRIA